MGKEKTIKSVRKEVIGRLKAKENQFDLPKGRTFYIKATDLSKAQRSVKKFIFIGLSDIPENRLTPIEKMDLAKEGISKKNLEDLKNLTHLDYEELAQALSVTRSTLISKKDKEKFSPSLSERIVSLADIYSYGYEVFEDVDKFNEWMFHPNQALGGKYPFEIADNQFGREEIRNIIGRIDYGVYS